MIIDLHHIQLAMPRDGENAAREFYSGVLSLREVEKPEVLKLRGGAWFETGNIRVHLGVETPFKAAKKAHPAFQVSSLKQTISILQVHGIVFHRDMNLPQIRRIYVNDPFGNRIELLEVV